MDGSPSCRLLRVVLFFFLPLLFCPAAPAMAWTVAQMLAVKSPVILIKDSSNAVVLDEVHRSWLLHVVAVTQEMARVYEMPVPNTYIILRSEANAAATLDEGDPIIIVNTGMLHLVGDDEDLMAAVIGHEFGHIKAGHLTRGRELASIRAFIGQLAGALVDVKLAQHGRDSQGLGKQVGALGAELVNAKYSRDQEREADDLGIRNMARAGYDPAAMPRLWRLMEAQGGGGSGLWLSSHPSNEERLQTMQAVAASLTDIYAANKSARVVAARETASRVPVALGVVTAAMPVTAFGVEGVDGAMVTAVVRGGAGFSDTGISGFRTGRQRNRRNEVHEEAKT